MHIKVSMIWGLDRSSYEVQPFQICPYIGWLENTKITMFTKLIFTFFARKLAAIWDFCPD